MVHRGARLSALRIPALAGSLGGVPVGGTATHSPLTFMWQFPSANSTAAAQLGLSEHAFLHASAVSTPRSLNVLAAVPWNTMLVNIAVM